MSRIFLASALAEAHLFPRADLTENAVAADPNTQFYMLGVVVILSIGVLGLCWREVSPGVSGYADVFWMAFLMLAIGEVSIKL